MIQPAGIATNVEKPAYAGLEEGDASCLIPS
jgi:hypothetical protein